MSNVCWWRKLHCYAAKEDFVRYLLIIKAKHEDINNYDINVYKVVSILFSHWLSALHIFPFYSTQSPMCYRVDTYWLINNFIWTSVWYIRTSLYTSPYIYHSLLLNSTSSFCRCLLSSFRYKKTIFTRNLMLWFYDFFYQIKSWEWCRLQLFQYQLTET